MYLKQMLSPDEVERLDKLFENYKFEGKPFLEYEEVKNLEWDGKFILYRSLKTYEKHKNKASATALMRKNYNEDFFSFDRDIIEIFCKITGIEL